MADKNRSSGQRGRVAKNSFTTKSGKTIKIHSSIGDRMRAKRELRAQKKAAYLATLPKGRLNRIVARLHPKRLYKYWFSREGGIMALKLLGIATVAGFLMLVGLFAYFRKDLPNLKDISGKNLGGSNRYYDRSGQVLLWEDFDAVKRVPIKSEEMPKYMKDATVAIEDKDFYKHGGFDVRGIARAGINNVTGGGGTQGGSTITQQLVKLTQNWTKDRTYTRKIKELILAVELERSYSKDQILTGYLNTAPYGNVQNGIEAASRDYFEKSAKDLTLSEAAFLAAIPKSPSLYSPYGAYYDPKDLKTRTDYILDQMNEQHMITAQQRDEAKKVDVIATVKQPKQKYAGMRAPYFVLAAKAALMDKYGSQTVKRGGWAITTTLDLNLQDLAEQQVTKGLAQVRRQGGDNAAFAAEDVTNGQMVALVGGPGLSTPGYGEINYATTPLPPGSSFKPYDYISLMENTTNFGAGSVLYDTQGVIDGYPCTNKQPPKQGGNCLWDYDLKYPGPITLRYALGGSRNVPAVKAMLIAGVDKTIGVAEKLGLKSGYKCYQKGVEDISKATSKDEDQCYASSAIGDGAYLHLDEHVHAYSTISRNGLKYDQTYILKIADASNKPLFEWKQPKGEQAVRADSAYIVADMMSDPNASYFPAGRKPHRYTNSQGTWKFGMKTGTTNDGKDGWMMGFSTKYAAGVWVGYHTRQKAMSGTMENMTQPIWQGWMNAAHKDLKPVDRQKPASVQTLPAFVIRSHVGIGSVEPSPSTDLFPSWYKQPSKKTGTNQTIDQVSNKLATTCTPDRAKKTMNDADANTFSGDTFVNKPGANANTTQTDDVHNCNDAKPSVTLTATGCSVIATVTAGTHPLNSTQFNGTVQFVINGQVAQSSNVSDSPSSVSFTAPSGTTSITGIVIDSVLYDASDTVNLDCGSAGGGPSPLTLDSPNVSGNNAAFTWSGGNGTYTVYVSKAGGGSSTCTSTTSSCTATLSGSGNYSAYVKDSNGNQSSAVAFSR